MKRSLATLLFIVLGLPMSLFSLLLIGTRPWALERDTYRRIVDDDRLYAAITSPDLSSRINGTIEPELKPKSGGTWSAKLDARALAVAAQKNLPVAEIKATADAGIDSVLSSVERGSGDPSLDIRALKSALKSRKASIARDYVAALPPADDAKPSSQADLSRRWTGLSRAAEESAVASSLESAVAALPDTVAPSELPAPAKDIPIGIVSRGPDGLSQALLNRMTASMAAISALLLAGLGALGGRNAIERISRAGKYLAIPSVIVLVLGGLLAIPGGLILQDLVPREVQGALSGPSGAQLRDYLASVLGPIARSFFLTGLVGTSLGGVLASARKFWQPKEIE